MARALGKTCPVEAIIGITVLVWSVIAITRSKLSIAVHSSARRQYCHHGARATSALIPARSALPRAVPGYKALRKSRPSAGPSPRGVNVAGKSRRRGAI
jgi:hypothetical protein